MMLIPPLEDLCLRDWMGTETLATQGDGAVPE